MKDYIGYSWDSLDGQKLVRDLIRAPNGQRYLIIIPRTTINELCAPEDMAETIRWDMVHVEERTAQGVRNAAAVEPRNLHK